MPDSTNTDDRARAVLGAVLRSLNFALTQPAPRHGSPFLGASCALLLARCSVDGVSESLAGALAGAQTLLADADSLEGDARTVRLSQAADLIRGTISLTGLGFRAVQPEALAKMVVPRARRERKGKKERKAAPAEPTDGAAAGQAAPEAASPAESTATPDPAAEVEVPPPAEASTAQDDVEPDRPEPQRSPKPAPPPPTPALHDEGAAGVPLSALVSADEAVVAALSQVGIETVADLLMRPPVHLRRTPMAGVEAPESGEPETWRGNVLARLTRHAPQAVRRELILGLADGRQVLCRWLTGAPRGWDRWQVGGMVGFVGARDPDADQPTLYEAEPLGVDGRGAGLLAEYGIEGATDARLRALVAEAVLGLPTEVVDPLHPKQRSEHRLMDLVAAIRDAHFPANTSARGRVRLAFDELLTLQIGVAWKAGRGRRGRGVSHKALHDAIGKLDSQHGIALSDGQERAFSEIRRDVMRSQPMARLLQGEVGAGKNAIALLTAVLVAENRSQVAMVHPDPLAAERRFLFAEPLLRSVGITAIYIPGEVGHAQADALRRGEAHVVYGTAPLLDPGVEWRRLGLVVAEERASFGTVTPDHFKGKGPRPDLLVVTRVPIPTSLTLSVFGQFDVSLVPRDRTIRVGTKVHTAAERDEAYLMARELLAEGRQVYVVFPVRDGRDLLGPEDAMRMAEALQSEALPDARIGIYCSAMSRDERSRAFDDFRDRRLDVLVCTTYIEEAPVVDNATGMVIEYADLHDLIRLHRLGIHVGMGTRRGRCAMVMSDNPAQEGAELVALAARERDGFRLAEHDLKHRGVEAVLASGTDTAPDFAWADPTQDRQLLLRARSEAFRVLGSDPHLRQHAHLGDQVRRRWGAWLGPELPEVPPPDADGGRRRRRRRRRRR